MNHNNNNNNNNDRKNMINFNCFQRSLSIINIDYRLAIMKEEAVIMIKFDWSKLESIKSILFFWKENCDQLWKNIKRVRRRQKEVNGMFLNLFSINLQISNFRYTSVLLLFFAGISWKLSCSTFFRQEFISTEI